MNYREKIREAISCPQFGDNHYGEWGALRLDQRKLIKRLLDELDRADETIKYLQQRIEKSIENWNILKRHFEFLKINTTGGNKEFMEDILEIMNILEGGENNR